MITGTVKFTPDKRFNPSFKMGEAFISWEIATSTFPKYTISHDGKSEANWQGYFYAANGVKMRASFWDWHRGLKTENKVSIWVSDPQYLLQFKQFLESLMPVTSK